jgi:hypothetical protein
MSCYFDYQLSFVFCEIMNLIYKPENNGKDLTDYDCVLTTGYDPDELISFTGADYAGNYNRSVIIDGIYPAVRINIKHNDFSLSRTINFEEQIIYNELFTVRKTRKGLGKGILKSQVDVAFNAGFERIKLFAMGDYQRIKKWNGYITWGKLGFTMEDFERHNFNNFLITHNREEKHLHELLSTSKGEQILGENGYSWFGEFILKEDSLTRQLLNNYINK